MDSDFLSDSSSSSEEEIDFGKKNQEKPLKIEQMNSSFDSLFDDNNKKFEPECLLII